VTCQRGRGVAGLEPGLVALARLTRFCPLRVLLSLPEGVFGVWCGGIGRRTVLTTQNGERGTNGATPGESGVCWRAWAKSLSLVGPSSVWVQVPPPDTLGQAMFPSIVTAPRGVGGYTPFMVMAPGGKDEFLIQTLLALAAWMEQA